jgi:hypothetical protein
MRISMSSVLVTVLATSAPALAGPIKMVKQGMVRVELQPNGRYTAKAVRSTELTASYAPPPRPSKHHVCKRADLDTKVVGARGGEVFTKGACSASTKGPHSDWPLKASFQMTQNVRDQAGRSCRTKWAKRKRDKHPKPNNSFMFANQFDGKIHIRYCFLDTKRKKVDCGKEGIHRTHTVKVSYLVSCVPPK